MSDKTFKIVIRSDETKSEIKEVPGRRITILGVKCGIRKTDNDDFWGAFEDWEVTHLETGMRLSYGMKRKDAIAMAEKRLTLPKSNEIIEKGRKEITELGFKLPINS